MMMISGGEMRVVDHSDCEYNTKKQNGYIIISHAACQAAWDITTYHMLLVTRLALVFVLAGGC